MTTFMKFEIITYYVLKVLGYIAGFVGVFAALGAVGSLEWQEITIKQCIIHELYAFCLIGFSIATYYFRAFIKEDVIKRGRRLRRKNT